MSTFVETNAGYVNLDHVSCIKHLTGNDYLLIDKHGRSLGDEAGPVEFDSSSITERMISAPQGYYVVHVDGTSYPVLAFGFATTDPTSAANLPAFYTTSGRITGVMVAFSGSYEGLLCPDGRTIQCSIDPEDTRPIKKQMRDQSLGRKH